MISSIFRALRLTIISLVFFSGVYTLVIYGAAQLAPGKGKGDTIVSNGHRYYTNIGQAFTSDGYFNSRPSAVGYNAAGSGGSNKGPTNAAYLAEVQARIDTFLVHNPGVGKADIPVELVTASGSGLDPDLTVKAATIQVKRIAMQRHISEAALNQLIRRYTAKPMLGPDRVNVLQLNLALDRLQPKL
ncbi:K(+)-transporting ATPase subunit C [Taibaiella chishuiensis]|uniref:Potassium-transporting ATPase KdpC subunit n=1 Tax=Taibaiella chishuiensis TaxID=1434707 RepID=A0A2P8D0G9_9BACT|nr:K(+)-transporting ATPase subunit C [Taibaiella chishuiensis]PSK90718.1 K+-transporting ATPase ATPase C chain [Taibaiella chishuiensis]